MYYWLGKHAEGRKQFDELLKAKGRDTDTLIQVSYLLREVGANPEARALAEEVYKNAADPAKKQQAAFQRSLIFTDLDDEILWLGRSNQEAPSVKASLATTLGSKAIREGKDEEAIPRFREAIELYASLPPSPGSLNNAALAYFALYHVNGERERSTRGLPCSSRLALAPKDSILLGNFADRTLEAAVRDLIGDSLDMKLLKAEGSLGLLAYLYKDRAGMERTQERVRKHPGIARAIASYDRLLILCPKRSSGYQSLLSIQRFTNNAEGLRSLQSRLETADLDQSSDKDRLEFYTGKADARWIADLKVVSDRQEAILKAVRKGPAARPSRSPLTTWWAPGSAWSPWARRWTPTAWSPWRRKPMPLRRRAAHVPP